jgi:hypothetical protein
MSKPLNVKFYMQGGHVVEAIGVKKLTMSRDPGGGYSAYTIEWMWPDSSPELFTLSVPDIVAVVATEIK